MVAAPRSGCGGAALSPAKPQPAEGTGRPLLTSTPGRTRFLRLRGSEATAFRFTSHTRLKGVGLQAKLKIARAGLQVEQGIGFGCFIFLAACNAKPPFFPKEVLKGRIGN